MVCDTGGGGGAPPGSAPSTARNSCATIPVGAPGSDAAAPVGGVFSASATIGCAIFSTASRIVSNEIAVGCARSRRASVRTAGAAIALIGRVSRLYGRATVRRRGGSGRGSTTMSEKVAARRSLFQLNSCANFASPPGGGRTPTSVADPIGLPSVRRRGVAKLTGSTKSAPARRTTPPPMRISNSVLVPVSTANR